MRDFKRGNIQTHAAIVATSTMSSAFDVSGFIAATLLFTIVGATAKAFRVYLAYEVGGTKYPVALSDGSYDIDASAAGNYQLEVRTGPALQLFVETQGSGWAAGQNITPSVVAFDNLD